MKQVWCLWQSVQAARLCARRKMDTARRTLTWWRGFLMVFERLLQSCAAMTSMRKIWSARGGNGDVQMRRLFFALT